MCMQRFDVIGMLLASTEQLLGGKRLRASASTLRLHLEWYDGSPEAKEAQIGGGEGEH